MAEPSVTRRNFVRLLAASGFSNIADGVFGITLPLVALGITRDPGAFASVAFVGGLPWLLVALPAGALADRLDRRRTMVTVNLVRVALIGALAVVVTLDLETLWTLYVFAFALGVGETLFDTAAQSILPNIIDSPDRLSKANGRLYAVELTANQFIGPPLGGLLAGLALAAALTASALAYLAAAVVLALILGQFRPIRTGAPTRLRTDVVEGIRYLFRHRLLRVLAVCVGISNLSSTAMISVLPLYAIRPGPVGLSEVGYGLLLTALAAGSLAGSALVVRAEQKLGPRRVIVVAAAGFPLFSIAPALTSSAVRLAAAFFVGGACSVGWNIVTVSLRQRIVPDRLLGRVNAGYRLIAWGTIPLGAVLGGLTAARFGIAAAFWTAAAISALCTPLVLLGTTANQFLPSEPAG